MFFSLKSYDGIVPTLIRSGNSLTIFNCSDILEKGKSHLNHVTFDPCDFLIKLRLTIQWYGICYEKWVIENSLLKEIFAGAYLVVLCLRACVFSLRLPQW